MRSLKEIVGDWIGEIVREELKHREHPSTNTDDLVRLILDLHSDVWSIQSESFVRRMNINPSNYKIKSAWRTPPKESKK